MGCMTKPTRHDLYEIPRSRLMTGPLRALPDYIILGAQKAGTTTIYDNLVKHPKVLPASIKEVHFFDRNWQRGTNWYRAHFPLRHRLGQGAITGEGSPYYLFHPLVPERIKAVCPKAKLIVILRNPVDRAYSHYQHEARKGREIHNFEEALNKEPERLEGEWDRLVKESGYHSNSLQHYSYLARGFYADQLERWFPVFPREQFLILLSQELNKEFDRTLSQVHEFLGVPHVPVEQPRRSNVGSYDKMSPETRERLVELYREPNARLAEMLGRDLGWDK